jgi:crotonobetainyl-CoA:carnitine CoA-transferase CaiB-like acyl-CoA transferase
VPMASSCMASLFLALMLFQQVPRQRAPRQQQTPNPQGGNADAIATFNGTFKSADGKFLTIAVEDDQTMRMYITRSTRFIRGGKPAKVADFHTGENVTVDASRDARLNLLAVRVEAVPAKVRERQPDKPDK